MQSIETVVKEYAARPIAVTESRYRPIVDQHRVDSLSVLTKFEADLEKVFGWHPANPSNPKRVEVIESLYEPTDVHTGKSSLRELLLQFLTSSGQQRGFLLGRRGSGKTALSNYVFSVENSALQEAGFTWLRADIAKLHAVNEELILQDKISPAECWSVNDYMVLHGLTVMIEHAKHDKVFMPTFKSEGERYTNGASPVEARLATGDGEIGRVWKLIREADHERRDRVAGGHLKKDRDQDLKWYLRWLHGKVTSEQIHELFCRVFALACQDYQGEYGILPKLILVFDGVDNIRADEHAPKDMQLAGISARQWYLRYLGEMREYLNGGGGCLPHDKCLFVIRNDTEEDMGGFPLAHQQEPEKSCIRIEVRPPNIGKLFNRKLEFTKKSGHYCLEVNAPLDRSERLEQFSWFFGEFTDAHCRALQSVSKLRTRGTSIDDVIDVTFNQNVRSFSRNLIRSFGYLHQFAIAHPDYQSCRTADDRLAFLKRHGRIILEGSMLAGNRFMRLNFDEGAKGRWCPNFFEFAESTNHRWDGLIILRVLQLVPPEDSNEPSPTLTEIKLRLESLGYSNYCSHVAVYTCLDSGLVALGDVVRNDELGVHEFSLHKTLKGSFLKRMVFASPINLYLIGTGATFFGVPANISNDPNKNPYLYRFTSPRYFAASALRTSALLLRHIQSAHLRDMQYLETVGGLSSGTAVGKTSGASQFVLPDLSKVLNGMRELLEIGEVNSGERSEIERLLEEWHIGRSDATQAG